MSWRETLRTATEAVRTHRLRSALTVFGILIGITAVTLTVGLGNGAKAQVRDQINELGTNLLVISPGSATDSAGLRGGFGSASTLTQQDAEALADQTVAPDVGAVAPVATTQGSLSYGTENWTTELTGTTPAWKTVRSRAVTYGRFITAADDAEAAKVVVLGPDTAVELFGLAARAVGQDVIYNGTTLRVIGVLSELSSSDNARNNDLAIVPLATYSQRLVGGADRNRVNEIYVKATSSDTISAAYQEAHTLLLNLHGITSSGSADFSIATQQSILSAASSVDQTMTVMLAGIAVISLLVGGIGVMNIMLVSVTERTREIGVRKAMGARRRDIILQFLIEAGTLTGVGGILGILVGSGTALLIQFLMPTYIPAWAPIVGFVVSVGLGVVFGLWPAWKAARLDPIEALRYE